MKKIAKRYAIFEITREGIVEYGNPFPSNAERFLKMEELLQPTDEIPRKFLTVEYYEQPYPA